MHLNELVGSEIRRLRREKGLTLQGLARTIGFSAPFLHDVERGRRNARPWLPAIARALGLSPDHFAAISAVCPTCNGSGRIHALEKE